jgi:hypothetical protein
MSIQKVFIPMLVAFAMIFAAGGTGSGTMGGSDGQKSNPGYGDHNTQQGTMSNELTGKITSINKTDSTIILKNSREDTIKVTPQTEIIMNGVTKKFADLKANETVKVWYSTENGKKVATRITEHGKKKGSMGGTENDGKNKSKTDTMGTSGDMNRR